MAAYTYLHCSYDEMRVCLPSSLAGLFDGRPDLQCVYAADNGQIMGFMLFTDGAADAVLHIHYILVVAAMRRKGVATGMVRHTMQLCGGQCRSCVAVVNVDNKHNGLDLFFCSMGFSRQTLNASIYRVPRTEWESVALPRIRCFAGRSVVCSPVMWQDMDQGLQSMWLDHYTTVCTSINLRPQAYSDDAYKKLFFHTPDGKPVGWVVVSLIDGHIASLDSIFILPAFRGGGTVFSLYGQATQFVVSTWPDVDGLHFQLDTFDAQLCRFYDRLLRGADYILRNKYRYEISLLSSAGQ